MNFIPYGKQNITEADIEAVVNVLKSDYLTQGPKVPIFESEIAKFCGAKYAVAMNSATSALHTACMALELGPNDWLWTSPNSFVASANCAIYCGAKVDFVDIDSKTYNISIECLEKKLKIAKSENKLPKIIIPVHFAGQSCEMEAIFKLSKQYNFHIIEDASHAIGGKYLDEYIGQCRYSDITIFSFHPVKIITTAEGGVATTNNESIYKRLQRHRSHGITSDKNDFIERPTDEIWNYQQIYLGYNYRMTDLQAALGSSQLKNINKFIEKRHEIASRYNKELFNLPIILPFQIKESFSSLHLYPIRINTKLTKVSQIDLYKFLLSNGVGVNIHYIPIYRQPYYEKMGFKKGYCLESESFHKEILSLPIFFDLTYENQTKVITMLKSAFR
jgi:UDP-4-amino-4,6-dideoxy-N-acetyl-beta-L-altrosamine transaminase